MGRLLSSRDRFGGMRARRAVVKTRLVRIGSKGMPAARAHLRYIQRDGVTREGAPGKLYSAERDTADGKAFLQRCDGDRHQFRFIVSAEDGAEYPDLKPYVRRLMTQMERSEEHTSELQSLMRISYAVFCLKKKNSDDGSFSANCSSAYNVTQNTSLHEAHKS